MKSLHTLLKVAQRRMDELGVEAVRMGQHIEQLRIQHAAILAREESEVALSIQDPALASMLPAYRARIKLQAGAVMTEIGEKEELMAEVRTMLNAAYQEKAKFEQLIEQEVLRKATERATRDQAALDEVTINRAGLAK